MDPFENYDQQERSFEQMKKFQDALATEAAAALRERPGGRFLGFITERGSHEFRRLRTMLEQSGGIETATPVLNGVVPIEVARSVVDPQVLDGLDAWIATKAGPGTGRLPIVVCTKDGVRFAAVPLPPGPDGP